jgi:thiosulfate/3-mercaptopyruvate sulfurtransferase
MSSSMYSSLIQLPELLAFQRSGSPLVVLDSQFDLASPDAGEKKYTQQPHVPGSHYAHLERDLSGPKHDASGRFRGRHPLPSREQFAMTVARWGITPNTQVVVLDDQAAMFAARAWWMLRWLGHDAAAVLDGGLAAWRDAGQPVSDGSTPKTVNPTPYPQRPPLVGIHELENVMAQLGQRRIVDARAPERFRGDVEPLDAAAGHIPGAHNRPFKDNLQANGRFKPAQVLRDEWQTVLAGVNPSDVVHQCGSGVTACHNLLALEIAGLGGGLLFPGSWSQWCADASRPVARG